MAAFTNYNESTATVEDLEPEVGDGMAETGSVSMPTAKVLADNAFWQNMQRIGIVLGLVTSVFAIFIYFKKVK